MRENFRDQNSRMVPLMLKRLRQLQNTRDTSHDSSVSRPFAHLAVNANEEIKKSASENPSESPKHKTPTTPQENGFMSPPHLLSPTMPTEHEFQTPNKVENVSSIFLIKLLFNNFMPVEIDYLLVFCYYL